MMSLWPDPDVLRAATAAFARSDTLAALDGLGASGPIGPDLPLATAVVLVSEAARAGHALPVAGRLIAQTVAGGPADWAALSDGGPCPMPHGVSAIVVVTGAGARLTRPADARPVTDPLQGYPWADPAPGPVTHPADLRPLAWTLLAAEALGAAEAAFALGVNHLGTRRQFGRLLGSFQTLRHRAAADWVLLEDMRAALAVAAHLYDTGDSGFAQAARVAKATASAQAPRVVEHAIHAMGAMGFTWAGGQGEPLMRTRHAAALFGTADDHYRALGARQTPETPRGEPCR